MYPMIQITVRTRVQPGHTVLPPRVTNGYTFNQQEISTVKPRAHSSALDWDRGRFICVRTLPCQMWVYKTCVYAIRIDQLDVGGHENDMSSPAVEQVQVVHAYTLYKYQIDFPCFF